MEYYLAHHGIKGQKWGVRRYQNPDGTLTAAGKKRYGIDELDTNSKFEGSKKQKVKALKAEAKLLKKRIDVNQQDEDISIFEEAVARYNKKHGKNANPDDWDYDFEKKQKLINQNAANKSVEYVNEYLTNKYGQETVDALVENNKRTAKAIKWVAPLTTATIGIGATGLVIYGTLKDKK